MGNLRSLVLLACLAAYVCVVAALHHYEYNPVTQHRTRHRRQGARLSHPSVWVIPKGEGTGAWSNWGDVSACSRTCGGGVSYQTRICLEVTSDGRALCTGGDRKYFSCNTQDCPEDSQPFRAEQCAEYDNKPFQGVNYSWVPYTKSPNPCELNCMPRKERFYFRHQDKVKDGTPCNDEAPDICVDGQCMPVGCDMLLGSTATEDKCRECRGNGSTCRTIEDVYDNDELISGYNDILLIPKGATNIEIRELRPSNNYLAIRNQKGDFYLNGHYRIDFPRAMPFAGAVWRYERQVQGLPARDAIYCQGPTDEPLYLSLIYFERNQGIQYEYSIPTSNAAVPDDQYAWVTEEFAPCSASCGGGFQDRNVTCMTQRDLIPSEESLCDSQQKPPLRQACAEEPCTALWSEGPWNNCSSPCGEGGTQSRQVSCTKIISNGLPSIVDDEECVFVWGAKPNIHRSCNKGLECPSWHIGPWRSCDKLCGTGQQKRSVRCYRKVSGKVEVLADEECADVKPASRQECFLHPCEGVDWLLTDWTGCDSCLSKVRTRTAQCGTQKGEIFPASFCSYHPDPVLQEPCDEALLPACGAQWFSSQWSPCSGACGEGVQSRTVFCGSWIDDTLRKVDAARCNITLKLEDARPCDLPVKDCPAEWLAGPWSECSKQCGGGEQTRKVLCLRNNKTAPVTECNEDSILDSVQTCNTKACDEDELLPVDSSSTPPSSTDETDDYDEEDYDCEDIEDGAEKEGGDDVLETSEEHTTEAFTDSGYTDLTSSLADDELMQSDGTTFTSSDYTDESGSGFSTLPIETESEETASGDISISTVEGATGSTLSSDSSMFSTESSTTSDLAAESTTSSAIEDISEKTSSSSEAPSSESSTIASSDSTDFSSTDDVETEFTEAEKSTESGSTTDKQGSSTDSSSSTEITTESATFDSSSTTDTSTSDSSTNDMSTTDSSTTDWSTTDYSTETIFVDDETTLAGSTVESESTTDLGSTSETELVPTTELESTKDSESTTDFESTTSAGSTTEFGSSTDSSSDSATSSDVTDTSTDSSSTDSTSVESSGTTEETSTDGSSTAEYATDVTVSESSTMESTSVQSSTEEGSTQSEDTESTVTEQSTWASSTDSSTESTSTESELFSSSAATDEGFSDGSTTSSYDWSTTIEAFTKKIRKCRRRLVKPKCINSKFGCCNDNRTAAKGPFDQGCPNPKTCNETKHGCCPDGVSVSRGPAGRGCVTPPCNATLFGCCHSDNVTAAQGNEQEGCPAPPPKCLSSKFGCCADNITAASGHKKKGCPETTPTTMKPTVVNGTAVLPQVFPSRSSFHDACDDSEFGCCADNVTAATGPDAAGCPCNASQHGCCPDSETAATGPNLEGCGAPCLSTPFGCCPDNVTSAHGPHREGCCLTQPYGCCPDNVNPARGPELYGCGCQWAPFGCCPDNETVARGHNYDGCGCQHSPHGCCPDRVNAASGANFEGCGCHTYQFGCCADGVTVAKGPQQQGCRCLDSEYKCCGDGVTSATGPDQAGCDCSSSRYGCCPDGRAAATGERFEGCVDAPVNLQAACSLKKDSGSCRNYTVRWYYDMVYGGCSRFWYEDCEGNDNRFNTQEDCKAVCVSPQGKDVCKLPVVRGACDGHYQMWYFDEARGSCEMFDYGGCLGNDNKFKTKDECQQLCGQPADTDECALAADSGPCAGEFPRWAWDAASGACQQFRWGGCQGNNNRFRTELACEQHCNAPGVAKDLCALPRETGNCTDKIPRWHFDKEENRCLPFYYSGCHGNANQFSSEAKCNEQCPKVVEHDVCTIPSSAGDCADYKLQWYFDTSIQRCRQFYYGGCGGNGNNFPSEEACTGRCMQQITTTVAPTQEPVFKSDHCFLEADPGSCDVKQSRTERRWYYEQRQGICREFVYSGCYGNQNNFPTREHCQHYCSKVQDICQLPMLVGPCNGSYSQWFYDKGTDSCSQFAYGGCEGNDNRFNTREECVSRCKVGNVEDNAIDSDIDTQESDLPAQCWQPMDVGPCRALMPAWYFDSESRQCRNYYYGGCQGNENRFASQEECERTCGEFRGLEVCRYPLDAGSCHQQQRKFYFDEASGRCAEFTYGGCAGGPNRFSSAQECETLCGSNEVVTNEKEEPKPVDECQPFTVYCSELQCLYGRKQYVDASGCDHCECYDPCLDKQCGEDASCGVYRYRDETTGQDKIEAQCVPKSTEEEDKSEPEEDPCRALNEHCETLRCQYGHVQSTDEKGCPRCECRDPCQDIACGRDAVCAVDSYRDETTGEIKTETACRPFNKPGSCPVTSYSARAEEGCARECDTDAHCAGADKCCVRGCSRVCTAPAINVPTASAAFTTPAAHATHAPHTPLEEAPRAEESEAEPEVSVSEGGLATLRCVVYGNPAPLITWSKDSISIDGSSGRFRITTAGELQIVSVYRNDSGVYVCVADNGVGKPLRKEVNLQVNDPTELAAGVIGGDREIIQTRYGRPVVLRCQVYGFPTPTVFWWKNQTMITPSQRYELRRDFSLLIRSLDAQSLGEYTCQAYNGYGKSSSRTVIVRAEEENELPDLISRNGFPEKETPVLVTPKRVQETTPTTISDLYIRPPQPNIYRVPVHTSIDEERMQYRVDDALSLPCVAEGHPAPRVHWSKDGNPIVPDDRIEISESNRLSVYNLRTTDSGEYRCDAQNDFSSHSTTVFVTVEGVYIHPNCTDNPFLAKCDLIVRAKLCRHKYYADFCCKSCTLAGHLRP